MDDPDTIMRKFKRAVTDSEGYVSYRDEQPGVKNPLRFTVPAQEKLRMRQ